MSQGGEQTQLVPGEPSADSAYPLGRWPAIVLANGGLALLYALAGILGLGFAEIDPRVTLIWLPSGLALAAWILWGRVVLPGILVGAAGVGAALGGGIAATGVGAAAGAAEAALGGALLVWAGFSPRLGRARDLLVLVSVGATAAVAGATLDCAGLSLDGGAVTGRVWIESWLGRAGGVVIVTPMLLLGAVGTPTWRTLAGRAESWIVAAAIAAAAFVVFGGVVPSVTARVAAVFLPLLVMVWAGGRLGPRGAVGAASFLAVLALAGRARGTGPMGDDADVLLLWAYLLTLSGTAIVVALVVAQRDAADHAQRLASLELRDLEDQVRHAQRLEGIGLLAGGIAHDFNNLLQVIRANASLLDPVGTAQVEAVSEIDTASRRAADLCRQLMTYAGRGSPSMAAADLRILVEETCALLRANIPESVRIDLEHLAPTPVEVDPTQIRQAVMNLVLNGAEAMGDGGALRLRTGVMDAHERYLRQSFLHSEAAPGAFVFLEVEDEGCGMDTDTLRRMFDPFFTTKTNGRGLGLMTVAGVARSHGGAIKVTSTPGRGSCFRLLLPLSVRPPALDVAEAPPVPGVHTANGETILLADDEPAVLGATARILRRSGYVVLTARNGEEAFAIFQADPDRIDAVLMDVSMPGLTGPGAIARMREICPVGVPAVLMSGNLPDGVLAEGAGLQFVAKPFGVATLLEAVSAAVASGRQPRG